MRLVRGSFGHVRHGTAGTVRYVLDNAARRYVVDFDQPANLDPFDTSHKQWACKASEIESVEPASSASQPEPTTADGEPIYKLVVSDIRLRAAEGKRKYGTYLQAGNGRDALVDAYQEALDLAMYLRQRIAESS